MIIGVVLEWSSDDLLGCCVDMLWFESLVDVRPLVSLELEGGGNGCSDVARAVG
jgi:hypothetical protein